MKIYAALYCPMTIESSYGTISLHKSKENAEIAMKIHMQGVKDEFDSLYSKEEAEENGFKYDDYKAWCVDEKELLE